jgi:hypothetical protein
LNAQHEHVEGFEAGTKAGKDAAREERGRPDLDGLELLVLVLAKVSQYNLIVFLVAEDYLYTGALKRLVVW